MFWLMEILLSRSRYFYTKTNQSGLKQTERAIVLFELYPDIQKPLIAGFEKHLWKTTDKIIGLGRLARWHEK
jgi:hypothetical protein